VSGVLLDSDVIIEVLRGHRPTVDAVAALTKTGLPVCCCAVSWAEVYAGLRAGEEEATDAFFAARRALAIDTAMGRKAGAYLTRYRRSHGLQIGDALIAGAASASGLHLWTLDRRDYPMEDVRFYEPRA
jgi:hypothetical protein